MQVFSRCFIHYTYSGPTDLCKYECPPLCCARGKLITQNRSPNRIKFGCLIVLFYIKLFSHVDVIVII